MAEEVIEQPTLNEADQKALDRARGITTDDGNPYNDDGSLKNEPIDIPEKFKGKSLEDVVKAYTELEKKLSEKSISISEDPKPVEEVITSEEAKEVEDKVNATLTPKDFEKYEKAYLSEGKLDDAHYKELEAKGLSKEIIDLYIEGAKARDTIYKNSVFEVAGGEESYNELIKWASENIKDVEVINEINRNLTSGSVSKATMAIELLQAKKGTPPRRLEGTASHDSGGVKPYRDKSEWQKDARNPLYGRDKKFTEMVEAKYIASKRRGTI